MNRPLRKLVHVTGAMTLVGTLALLGADRPALPRPGDVIAGPLARLLAASSDLGPARA